MFILYKIPLLYLRQVRMVTQHLLPVTIIRVYRNNSSVPGTAPKVTSEGVADVNSVYVTKATLRVSL